MLLYQSHSLQELGMSVIKGYLLSAYGNMTLVDADIC